MAPDGGNIAVQRTHTHNLFFCDCVCRITLCVQTAGPHQHYQRTVGLCVTLSASATALTLRACLRWATRTTDERCNPDNPDVLSIHVHFILILQSDTN